jgi:hypothetical protein
LRLFSVLILRVAVAAVVSAPAAAPAAYDRDGNLTRRVVHLQETDGSCIKSLTAPPLLSAWRRGDSCSTTTGEIVMLPDPGAPVPSPSATRSSVLGANS